MRRALLLPPDGLEVHSAVCRSRRNGLSVFKVFLRWAAKDPFVEKIFTSLLVFGLTGPRFFVMSDAPDRLQLTSRF